MLNQIIWHRRGGKWGIHLNIEKSHSPSNFSFVEEVHTLVHQLTAFFPNHNHVECFDHCKTKAEAIPCTTESNQKLAVYHIGI